MFAAPSVATADPGASFAAFVRIIARAVVRGFLFSFGMLLVAVVTVYLSRTVVVGPDLLSLAECGLFGISLSAAVSVLVTFLTIYVSARVAQAAARLCLFALLGLFFLWSGWLPAVALRGAAICTAVALLFLAILWKTVPRRAPVSPPAFSEQDER
ncbi:MAG: hypothetical protein ABI995_14680 [Acidobacteriota bacterium]